MRGAASIERRQVCDYGSPGSRIDAIEDKIRSTSEAGVRLTVTKDQSFVAMPTPISLSLRGFQVQFFFIHTLYPYIWFFQFFFTITPGPTQAHSLRQSFVTFAVEEAACKLSPCAMGLFGGFPVSLTKRHVFSNAGPVRDFRTVLGLLGHVWRKRHISIAEMDPRLNHTVCHHSPLLDVER